MSAVNTPFIPPLNTPSAQRTPLPTEAPVLPTGHPAGAPPPNWGAGAHHSGAFPAYPRTPYTSTPYPNLPPALHTPAAPPGHYLPATTIAAEIAAHPQRALYPHPRDPGLSEDWIGFGAFNSPAAMGVPPIAVHPPTTPAHHPSPWAPMSAPLQPPGGYWGGGRQPYPPFGQPMSAGPYPAFPLPPQGPPAWGPPPGAPPHVTPGAPYAMNLDPYGGMTWAMMQHQAQAQAHTPAAAHHHHPHMQLPQHLVNRGGTALAQVGDRMGPFAAGRNYGPVLDPFLLKVVGARLKLNPLLEPLPENGDDRPHLKWNMLFKTNACQRSTDPGHVSWSNGRDEPCTFPRVTKVNIISEAFPWMVIVHASDPDIGVTCGEVIDSLSDDLHRLTSAADYQAAPDGKKQAIGEAYRYNRSRASGVPGGRLGDGLRRMDFLGRDAVFGGILNDERMVRRLIGDALPATFVVRCVRQYALTPEELREHELRERATEERESRRVRVETVDDDSTADDD